MATVDLSMLVPYKTYGYGAIEVKAIANKAMMIAISLSSTLALGTMGSYHGIGYLLEDEEPVRMVRLMKYTDLGPPPSIQNTQAAPAVAVAAAAVKPSIGIPVPVPDAEVSPEQTELAAPDTSQQGSADEADAPGEPEGESPGESNEGNAASDADQAPTPAETSTDS